MADYKSPYTGQQVDDAIAKVQTLVPVQGNPTTQPTISLRSIIIGNETYYIPTYSRVTANGEDSPTEELYQIEIDGSTYSIPQPTTVAGNVEGDYTSNLASLQIGDKIYLIPTYSTVSANDAEDPVNTLNNITINGTEYALSQLTVVGNPTTGGTDILRNIQIGDTIYRILQPHDIFVNDSPFISEPTEELYAIEIDGTCYSIPQPTRILFIDSTPYMSPFTITWADWVANTAYNTDGYRVLDGYIALPQGDDTKVVMLGDVAVLPTDSVATKNYVVGDKPISTVTIPSGIYKANDELTKLTVSQTINFTCGTTNFTNIRIGSYETTNDAIYYGETLAYLYVLYDPDFGELINVWQGGYKYITLQTDQEVSPEFAEWFNSNYTKQTARIDVSIASTSRGYIDLATYVGYHFGDLEDGTVTANGQPLTVSTTDGLSVTFSSSGSYAALNYNGAKGIIKKDGVNQNSSAIINSVAYTCVIPMSSG